MLGVGRAGRAGRADPSASGLRTDDATMKRCDWCGLTSWDVRPKVERDPAGQYVVAYRCADVKACAARTEVRS